MSSHAEEPVGVDEIRVPVHHRHEPPDRDAPSCMACRMGTWTRLVMLAFGMGPIAGAMMAFGAAWEGGYTSFLEHQGVAWLGYPLLIPFFTFAAIMLYGTLVVNNRRISTGSKIAWLLGIVLAGPIGIPAYWWVHVWRAPQMRGHAD